MNKAPTEQQPATWFFDDSDPDATFQFAKPNTKHQKWLNLPPVLSNPITCKNLTAEEVKQGFYALHGTLLVFYEVLYFLVFQFLTPFKSEFSTSCEAVLDISNARITPLEAPATGFTMNKNSGSFEFSFTEKQIYDNWIAALRNVCIFTNFHEEYRASKMIGKGSFAKVLFLTNCYS